MTVPATPMLLPDKAQEGLIKFVQDTRQFFGSNYNIREQMQDIDLAYQREQNWNTDHQRAKLANRYGDAARFQDVEVPVVMPQVETATTYQTSVFLTGVPLFGVTSNPAYIDAAMQMETIIDNQAIKGGWVAEFMKLFRDGFKYNLMAAEVAWESRTTAAIETDLAFDPKIGRPKEVIWEGNVVRRLDLYNTFWDSRVSPSIVPTEGEFAGYDRVVSRIALKQFIARLPDKITGNVKTALESPFDANTFFVPKINPDALIDRASTASFNWASWARLSGGREDINYSNSYLLTKVYVRILPSDFGLRVPAPNTAQVWMLYIINNSVIIYAERQTNAHDKIPIILASPLDDGLDYQTKSFATNVKGIQQTCTALQSFVMASNRRAISDRTLYNPSLINATDINNPNPSAKIPVKPNAYGRALSEAVYPFPYRGEQAAQMMSEIPSLMKFADMISGQNPAQQGQFVKGNRTLHEYDNVMGNSNGRNQMAALALEAQLFTPIKEILKINILQYQGTEALYSREKKAEVKVDPVALRKAVIEFKLSDGLMPSSKLINADAFQTSLQVIGSSEKIGAAYNLGPMFSYLMKSQGAHIGDFEKPAQQLQYEQAMGAWQQAVMQIAQTNPDIKPEQYPPQPKLADFGLDTNGKPSDEAKKAAETPPTIMQQLTQDSTEQSQQQGAAQA